MKPLIDIAQILLTNPIYCTLAAIGLLVVGKMFRVLLSDGVKAFNLIVARYFIRLSITNALAAVFVALVLIIKGAAINDYLQQFEQTQLNPVYQFEGTPEQADAVQKFETAIQKKVGSADFSVVQKYCQIAADTLGCDLLSIYAVALSECGLNPYEIHPLGCAAGWTQLTGNGCTGLKLDGQPVTLPTVKNACKNRDIEYIMQTALAYWIDRAKGQKVAGLRNFYMLVFAPGFVGCSPDAVLYEGANNPNYYRNKVFDGYAVDEKERIVRLNKFMDNRITAREVEIHVTKKMVNFLKSKD